MNHTALQLQACAALQRTDEEGKARSWMHSVCTLAAGSRLCSMLALQCWAAAVCVLAASLWVAERVMLTTCCQATLMLNDCCLQANEMARRVLADSETSEGDLAPAPKLLEIILQNCRARVDHCVAPYLQVGGIIPCFWCWLLILWVSSAYRAAPAG